MGVFLRFANRCLRDKYSGFIVLAIDCPLVETLQQFISGVTDGHGQSTTLSKEFLKGPRFQPYFNTDETRTRFYKDIRCGLLHQAEAKNKWLIRRMQTTMLRSLSDGRYILDVERFHAAIQHSLEDYFTLLSQPESTELRLNLWTKMDHICQEREARGALEEAETTSANQTA